ncbi:hypothetical protein [Pedobacter sp. UBA4863]|uniref:hypothetical protein n=1 Tax=Pedobacter sp. UBA4863 TaxID=1947060 RepID=UPI0025D7F1AC|nr:hypothetical protein [Pedobacter sp. UBA4863]
MPIPPISDAYIDEIIKSAGPYVEGNNKTQGVKLRELIKVLRDYFEQEIPKNTSDLTNDSNFVNSALLAGIPQEDNQKKPFIIKPLGDWDPDEIFGGGAQPLNTMLLATAYIDEVHTVTQLKISDGVTAFKDLKNLIADIDLSSYAKLADLPIKVSELENDSGFITEGDISGKANDSDVLHKTGDEEINGIKTFKTYQWPKFESFAEFTVPYIDSQSQITRSNKFRYNNSSETLITPKLRLNAAGSFGPLFVAEGEIAVTLTVPTSKGNGTLALTTDIPSPIDISGKEDKSNKGIANGYASLDANGKVPAIQLPSYVDDVLEYANLASFPTTGEAGKIYVALDTNKCYRWSGSAYIYITSGAVDSVSGKIGVVTLAKGDVGLGNIDNTSDLNKPISAATQNALNLKANNNNVIHVSGNEDKIGSLRFAAYKNTHEEEPDEFGGGIFINPSNKSISSRYADNEEVGTGFLLSTDQFAFTNINASATNKTIIPGDIESEKNLVFSLPKDRDGEIAIVDDVNEVADVVILKEDLSNKVINLDSPNHIKYPTTQAVADALAGKANLVGGNTFSGLQGFQNDIRMYGNAKLSMRIVNGADDGVTNLLATNDNISVPANISLPDTTGKLALISQIPDVSGKANLAGGNTFTDDQAFTGTIYANCNGANIQLNHSVLTTAGIYQSEYDNNEVFIGNWAVPEKALKIDPTNGHVTAPVFNGIFFNGSLNGSARYLGSHTNYMDANEIASVSPQGGSLTSLIGQHVNGGLYRFNKDAANAFLKINDGSTLNNNISGTASNATGLAGLPASTTPITDYTKLNSLFGVEVDGGTITLKPVPINVMTSWLSLSLKENIANKATDLTIPNDTKYPTTLAVSNELANYATINTNQIITGNKTFSGYNNMRGYLSDEPQYDDTGIFVEWDNGRTRLMDTGLMTQNYGDLSDNFTRLILDVGTQSHFPRVPAKTGLLAMDNEVVKLAGNQVVVGDKVFSGWNNSILARDTEEPFYGNQGITAYGFETDVRTKLLSRGIMAQDLNWDEGGYTYLTIEAGENSMNPKIPARNGYIAMAEDLNDKANLIGGNEFSGTQAINGNLIFTSGVIRLYEAGATNKDINVGRSSTPGQSVQLGWNNNSGNPFGFVSMYGGSNAPLALQHGGGNVLIGTTTDDGISRLQVNGSVTAKNSLKINKDGALVSSMLNDDNLSFTNTEVGITTEYAMLGIYSDAPNPFHISLDNNADFIVSTGGTNKLTVDGTNSGYDVTINGDTKITGNLEVATPTLANHAATKAYVDANAGGGAATPSFEIINGVDYTMSYYDVVAAKPYTIVQIMTFDGDSDEMTLNLPSSPSNGDVVEVRNLGVEFFLTGCVFFYDQVTSSHIYAAGYKALANTLVFKFNGTSWVLL